MLFSNVFFLTWRVCAGYMLSRSGVAKPNPLLRAAEGWVWLRYMQSEELKTVSMWHTHFKAAVICEHTKEGLLHMNNDGTTLQQMKLGNINKMVQSN